MASEATQMMALNANWLNSSSATLTTYPSGDFNNQWANWYYPTNHYTYWCNCSHVSRPIKLKMSEVEVLRAAAQKNAKLKDILSKFTPQIEVVVDFD